MKIEILSAETNFERDPVKQFLLPRLLNKHASFEPSEDILKLYQGGLESSDEEVLGKIVDMSISYYETDAKVGIEIPSLTEEMEQHLYRMTHPALYGLKAPLRSVTVKDEGCYDRHCRDGHLFVKTGIELKTGNEWVYAESLQVSLPVTANLKRLQQHRFQKAYTPAKGL